MALACTPHEEGHWTKLSLLALRESNIGWAKQVEDNLAEWGLEPDWDKIKEKSKNEWKQLVSAAAEKINKERLIADCHKKERGLETVKTKTRRIVAKIQDDSYTRKPEEYMKSNNKLIVRAYLMGRYGMLQCAANFSSGYGGKLCKKCGVVDDESHRINICTEWKELNLCEQDEKIDFEHIFSDNQNKSMHVVKKIMEMWDLGNGRNGMRSLDPI